MRTSLTMRAGCVCLAAITVLSLGLSPSFARMGGTAGGAFSRSGFGMGPSSHVAPHGFNRRFEAGRFGFNRFGPNRFGRFAFHRFNNPLLIGGWSGWGGYSAPAAAPQPVVVGDGAPVIINIGLDPAPVGAATAYAGGCVIHKLMYDSRGKYVGERLIPQC
ncbi:MAG TPA: hypothetical protein VLI91_04435 [Roseiarcus sp.]|nr:hypothetical protein [Roseiarcus sp.]